jgi:hypothetical protein
MLFLISLSSIYMCLCICLLCVYVCVYFLVPLHVLFFCGFYLVFECSPLRVGGGELPSLSQPIPYG